MKIIFRIIYMYIGAGSWRSVIMFLHSLNVILQTKLCSVPRVNSNPGSQYSSGRRLAVGRAIAEAVSRWLPTVAARVRARV
jgi:hypothetical protein